MIRLLAFSAAVAALGGAVSAQQRPWTPLPSPVSATCPEGLCQAEALAPLFRALDGHKSVRIVQFGDSHTAGRLITSAFETRLRARFPARDIRVTPIGVPGVTLNNLVRQRLPASEAAPDLIVLEYGVNEGFDDGLNLRAYERLLTGQIERFRTEAPGAAILILGAPEGMRGEGGGTCPGDTERRWRAPANLAAVRDVQFRTASRMGVAFWDWRGRMGGDCSAERLTRATAGEGPMMYGDHVHFTQAGADWIGGMLFDDLMTADRAWRARNPRSGQS